MHTITTDPQRNLLVIRFEAHVTATELAEHVEQVQAALANLQPSFQMLTDLSGLHEMEVAGASSIKKVMDLCRQCGIAKVVRVIPDPKKDIGFNIMSHFHYKRGVTIITCETLEEAMAALDPGGQGK